MSDLPILCVDAGDVVHEVPNQTALTFWPAHRLPNTHLTNKVGLNFLEINAETENKCPQLKKNIHNFNVSLSIVLGLCFVLTFKGHQICRPDIVRKRNT